VRLPRPRGVLWRNRDFLWLWAAQSVSQFGSQITGLALPLVAILVLDASAFEVAALGVVDWLPFFLFSLPAGAWIDRLQRRPILIAADWGRAVALASIPLAYLFDVLTLGQLYIVGFATGTLTMLFDLSYQSYLPSLVARDELGEGNSKLEISRSGAQVAGPGLAGVLVAALTAPYAILADAVSFVASGLFLSRIRRPERKPERSLETRPRLRAEIGEGLRFVLRHPLLRPIMIFVAVSNIFVNMLFAIFLVYAVRELGLSAQTIGLIFSLGNVGSVVGALTANRVARALGIGPSLIGIATLGGLGLLLIPLAAGDLVIPFLVIANLLWGFFVLNYYVTAVSLIQAITPDRLLGRTNASRRFVVQGVIPLGALLGGGLGTLIGLRPTILIGAVGASVAVLPLFFSPLRRVKKTADADEIVRPYNERFALALASPPQRGGEVLG
jgi:predicted MFS family arabinose efflux permease